MRRGRRFRPALAPLEARLPLDGDAGLAGPPDDNFVYPAGWLDPGLPIPSPIDVLPPPAEQIDDPVVPDPPTSVAPADPFDDPFAPPVDHTPGGPNPPESACPSFPPD